VLANMIGRIKDRSVLDVGTGTGRAALILARGGARVTAVDASVQCSKWRAGVRPTRA
jgi:2-polyprenyl-3-methyl-5-hydroxy-6-metoxy-1,4-benzoquinol methylase